MGWPLFYAPDVPRHDIDDADNGCQHHLCTRAQSQVRRHGCGNGARGKHQQVQRARQQFGSREHGCDNPPQRSGAHLRSPPVRLSHGSKGMMACGAFAMCQNHGQVWHNGWPRHNPPCYHGLLFLLLRVSLLQRGGVFFSCCRAANGCGGESLAADGSPRGVAG